MSEPMNITCPHCLKTNRVPADRLGDKPRCGACKASLLSAKPVVASMQNWARLTQQDLPVVVDFWAEWCGPCRMMAPVFEQMAERLQGRALFVKVETDQLPDLSTRFGIRSIPTLMILHQGKEVTRQPGAMAAPQFNQWLEKNLPSVPNTAN